MAHTRLADCNLEHAPTVAPSVARTVASAVARTAAWTCCTEGLCVRYTAPGKMKLAFINMGGYGPGMWLNMFNLTQRFDVFCYTMLAASEPGASAATVFRRPPPTQNTLIHPLAPPAHSRTAARLMAPQLHAPRSHWPTAPQLHSPTAPRAHSPTGQAHSPTAPQPHSSTRPPQPRSPAGLQPTHP